MAPLSIEAASDITALQNQASHPDYNVYVSASAGSGKTKVLVDRFVRLLLAGSEPHAILAVTFTTAAAKEMISRISDKLYYWHSATPEEVVEDLGKIGESANKLKIAKQLYSKFNQQIDTLLIKTIHAFAFEVLQGYWKKELLFPKIVNNNELQERIKNAVLEYYQQHASDEVLLERIHIEQIIALVNSAYYAQHITGPYTNNLEEVDLHQTFHNNKTKIDHEEIDQCFDYGLLQKHLLTQEMTLKKRPPKGVMLEKWQKLQDEFLALLYALNSIKVSNASQGLWRILEFVKQRISFWKSQSQLLEYSDLLIALAQVLTEQPHILLSLDYRIDHIMVDEAQDLSQDQWQIVKMLSHEFFTGMGQKHKLRTIFIVGDFKQSIYGFQGASPKIFQQIASYYDTLVTSVGQKWREVHLQHSFRSQPEILQFVDQLFNKHNLNIALGSPDLLKHYTVKNDAGLVKLYSLYKNIIEKTDGWLLPNQAVKQENAERKLIDDITNLIQYLLYKQSYLASDIMVIFRKRGSTSNALAASLRHAGISVADHDQSNPNDKLLFQDLLSLAKAVLWPHDAYNALCLLQSPFFNYPTNDAVEIITAGQYQELLPQETQLSILYSTYINNSLENFIARFGPSAIHAIDFFMAKIVEYITTYVDDIADFIMWFTKYVTNFTPDEQPGVKIITAHMAKGMQAPVVILADAASTLQTPHENLFVIDGLLCLVPMSEDHFPYTKAHQEHLLHEQYYESMRLLYVALTRSENELHIFGMHNNRLKGSWYDLMQQLLPVSELPILEAATPNTLPQNILWPEKKAIIPAIEYYEQNDATLFGYYAHLYLHSAMHTASKKWVLQLLDTKLPAHTKNIIVKKCEQVITKFPELFAPEVLSEHSIYTEINGVQQQLIIDKLIIGEVITIVDFKTDHEMHKESHREQLAKYHTAITQQFPNRTVKAYVLWVHNTTMELVI